MSWFKRIFSGSDHRHSRDHYYGNFEEGPSFVAPTSSKDVLSDSEDEDIKRAIALSLEEENQRKSHVVDNKAQLEEDEQLARALQEILNAESSSEHEVELAPSEDEDDPPQQELGIQSSPPRSRNVPSHQEHKVEPSIPKHRNEERSLPPADPSPAGHRHPRNKICAGCDNEIEHGKHVNSMNDVWHAECLQRHIGNRGSSDYESQIPRNYPNFGQRSHYNNDHQCDVCKHYIPANPSGQIEYRVHPFWHQKYCPSHEHDGTPRCCSCERLKTHDSIFIGLDDGRKLCLECLDTAIMDTKDCQPLYHDIQKFYEGLGMKLKQDIPLLLVERQALNEAMEGEKDGHHHMPETRGLCLSEEQTVRTVSRRPGAGTSTNMITESHKLTRHCEVTAVLILHGLPRLLTGLILAHELMHAWLRLQGYPSLRPEIEEGICQVLGYLWLDAELKSESADPTVDSKLGQFFKTSTESDTSPAYGQGFRVALQAVKKYGLPQTLAQLKKTGNFPYGYS